MPTIKYYLRKRLWQPGRLTSPDQAQYDDGHERRLGMIRALIEVGGLSPSAIADVLGADLVQAVAAKCIAMAEDSEDGPELMDARDDVAALV